MKPNAVFSSGKVAILSRYITLQETPENVSHGVIFREWRGHAFGKWQLITRISLNCYLNNCFNDQCEEVHHPKWKWILWGILAAENMVLRNLSACHDIVVLGWNSLWILLAVISSNKYGPMLKGGHNNHTTPYSHFLWIK